MHIIWAIAFWSSGKKGTLTTFSVKKALETIENTASPDVSFFSVFLFITLAEEAEGISEWDGVELDRLLVSELEHMLGSPCEIG